MHTRRGATRLPADFSSLSSQSESSRSQIFVWTLFDLANTSFSVLILTVAYPTYFTTIVATARQDADFLWALGFSTSMFITAIISPVLGAIADYSAWKKRFLLFFTSICVSATALMFFVQAEMIFYAIVLLVLANVGFEAGIVFYDAFLPEITSERTYGRVSGYGFAMGYVGSFAALMLAYPLLMGGFEAENLMNVRSSFLLAALFFLIFASPLFFFLRESKKEFTRGISYVRLGIDRVRTTLKDIRSYRNIARFLISYFLYIDGVNTVIIFSSIFAVKTLGMSLPEVVVFFLVVQSTAIGGSVLFGILADKFGIKRMLSWTLLIWVFTVIVAHFTQDRTTFYIVGLLAGAAMGSCQSTSRSLMSRIIPAEKKTEFFGFYSFFSKSSAILGPLVFGALSSLASQRIAVLSIGAFFLAGLILLQRVKDEPFQRESLPSARRN